MVQVIVERMMSYLRSTTDEHIKKDIVRKVRGGRGGRGGEGRRGEARGVSVSELAEYTPWSSSL